MWRTPANIPDISLGQLGREPEHYAGDCGTPSPSQSSYLYIQKMTSRCALLANPGKDPLDLLVLVSHHDQGEGRDETPALACGGHPFFYSQAWDRWGLSHEIGAGTTTTTRVSMRAAASKTNTMSITVTTTMIGWHRDRLTVLIAMVETLFKLK